jgi:hypothetical protein
MWRGFAVRKGVDSHKIAYLEKLFEDVSRDAEFLQYTRDNSSISRFEGTVAFQERVVRESDEVNSYLKKEGLKENYLAPSRFPLWGMAVFVAAIILSGLLLLSKVRKRSISESSWMAAGLLFVSFMMLFETLRYEIPPNLSVTSPGLVPQVWIFFLVICCLALLYREFFAGSPRVVPKQRGARQLAFVMAATALYFGVVPALGFPLATFLFLLVTIKILLKSSLSFAATVASFFVVACYVIFILTFSVDLPRGFLWSFL